MRTLQEKFEEFHENNPHVYLTLVRLAKEAKAKGKHPGIKMLFEVARWELYMSTVGDEFKLNNNYHSRYARLMMENESDLVGMFELRVLKA